MPAAALALVSMVALAPFLGRRTVARDEGASLYSAGLSLPGLFEQARVQDVVLVPYYLLLHVWSLPSDDVVWARVLSLLGYGAAVYFAARTAQTWSDSRWGLLAGVVTAVHPRMVEEVWNARPYALTASAAAAAGLGLARLDRGGARGAVLFVCGSTAAIGLHQFAGLGPLAALVVLAIGRRWRVMRVLRLSALPAALLGTLGVVSVTQKGQLAFLADLTPLLAVDTLLGPFGQRPLGGAPQAVLLGALAVAVLLRRRVTVPLLACAAWLVLPGVALVAVSVLSPVYGERYLTASAPAFSVLVALAAASLPGPVRRAGLVVVALVVAVSLNSAVRHAVRLPERASGFAELAPACAAGDVLAIASHMAEGALRQLVPDTSPRWPQVSQPYLERFRLDSSPAAFVRAPSYVTVCDVTSSYENTDLAMFERSLLRAGYVQVLHERAGDVIVSGFRRG